MHYVEKPETFVSNIINAGGYIFSPEIFQHLARIFTANYENELMYNNSLHTIIVLCTKTVELTCFSVWNFCCSVLHKNDANDHCKLSRESHVLQT